MLRENAETREPEAIAQVARKSPIADDRHPAGPKTLIQRAGASMGYRPSAGTVSVSIAVVDGHAFTRECIVRSLQELDEDLVLIPFAGSEEYLQSGSGCDLVLYYLHRSLNEDRLLPEILKTAPVIILSAIDDPEAISEALREGARGYVPTTSTNFNLTIEIVRLVRAGGTFVPPSSLWQRGSSPPCPIASGVGERGFTAREIAVLELLKIGHPNKIIAHELKLSESTVKVHIRNIMKKMNATNRTEVACRAHSMPGGFGRADGR